MSKSIVAMSLIMLACGCKVLTDNADAPADGGQASAVDGTQGWNPDGGQGPSGGQEPSSGGNEGDGDRNQAETLATTFRTLLTQHYLSASASGALSADAESAQAEQTFALTDLDQGQLEDGDDVLLAARSGKYLSAADGGGGAATASAVEAHEAEIFTLIRIDGPGQIFTGDRVALKTKAKENYLSALEGGGGAVTADAPWARGWETFLITLVNRPGPPPQTASAAKQKVLDFFAGISGAHTLAGIENKDSKNPHSHTDEVASLAGKTPPFWGIDFGFGAYAVDNRSSIITEAKRQWQAGAVVSFMYHTCIPTRDEYCSWDDIGGARPQHLTDSQWDELFTPGTRINAEWIRRLDLLAGYFKELRDAGVAPIFRPFHEMNQCVFWWSCKTGQNGSVRLWKYTHDYLVKTKGLDNIIWVWNIQDFQSLAADAVTYNPGPAYFDLATLDIYNTGYTTGNYQAIRNAAGGKPIGIGECQFLPTLEVLNNQPDWTFFMLWPDFIREQRNLDLYRSLLSSDRVTTLDEMPGWN